MTSFQYAFFAILSGLIYFVTIVYCIVQKFYSKWNITDVLKWYIIALSIDILIHLTQMQMYILLQCFFFLVLIVNFNKTSLFKSVNLIWTQGSSVFKPPWWRASNNELNIFLNRSVWRHLLNSKCNNKFINIFFAWVPSSLNL